MGKVLPFPQPQKPESDPATAYALACSIFKPGTFIRVPGKAPCNYGRCMKHAPVIQSEQHGPLVRYICEHGGHMHVAKAEDVELDGKTTQDD